MRRAARTDANKAAIVAVLREAGATVWDLKLPVDLLVGFNWRTALVEVKDGSKAPSAQKYTKLQANFMATWNGGIVATIRDTDGARRLIETMRYVAVGEKEGDRLVNQ